MSSPADKKRKREKDAGAEADLDVQSVVPALDTSKWPLLLKVCLQQAHASLTRV